MSLPRRVAAPPAHLTGFQRRVLEMLAGADELGSALTPTSLAFRLWPTSPLWARTSSGGVLPMNAARGLHALDRLGLAEQGAHGWSVTKTGRKHLAAQPHTIGS